MKIRLVAILTIVLAFGISANKCLGQYSYQAIKAALVFQLAQQIGFPDQAKIDTIKFGFLGDYETFKEFESFSQKTRINKKRVLAYWISSINQISDFQILVTDRSWNKEIEVIWKKISQEKSVLITEDCADQKYIMINLNFDQVNSQFSFEINKSNFFAIGSSFNAELLLWGGTEIDVVELFNVMRDSMGSMGQRIDYQLEKMRAQGILVEEQDSLVGIRLIELDSLRLLVQQIQDSSRILNEQNNLFRNRHRERELILTGLSEQILGDQKRRDSLQEVVGLLDDQSSKLQVEMDSLNMLEKELLRKLDEQENLLGTKEDQITLKNRSLIILGLLGLALLVIGLLIYGAFTSKRNLSKKLAFRVEEKTAELTEKNLVLLSNKERLEQQNSELESINEEMVQIASELEKANLEMLKAKEKAEKSDRLKSAFISNISHEIRTPLNSILGFSDLLLDPEIDLVLKTKYSEMVQSGGEQLLSIVGNIIDISLIESEEINLDNQDVDLASLFEKTFRKFEKLNTNDLIHLEIIPSDPLQIKTDLNRLTQVLDNLIGNALKYTISGSIRFGYERVEDRVLFQVQDTGLGISEEAQTNVFDRFYREQRNERIVSGTGLGLAIVKSLVERMGGRVWLTSQLSEGTIFFFELPV